jgi:cation diffusion facilitator CzcD-associated flavoprotein CzcO
MTAETDTIIIGAGPAGLAVGAVLRRAGLPFVMLERAECVGASWHHHYDRLRLHTPKSHSALPYLSVPERISAVRVTAAVRGLSR